MFSFLGLKLASMQALFHSWWLFLNFFGQVIHFCKFARVDLINTYFKFLQTLSSVVAYWHTLEKTWPKQVPWKLSSKPKVSHLTTDFKVVVNVFKFEPSSFTYVMILFFKPYASKSSIRFLTNACLVISAASNKPRVTYFSFQLDPKKIMTKTNTSCAPLDIHKS